MPRTSPLLVFACSLCALASAQDPSRLPAQAPVPPVSAFQNTGLALGEDGRWIGVGPDYVVRFDADTVAYTPALGRSVPHDQPLAYRLLGIGRGGTSTATGPAVPEVSGTMVRYRHAGCEATYELRTDGVKQSFVFATLPAGTGDLVVRAHVETELVPGAITPEGLTFTYEGVGGVRIGGVLGLDAAGNQALGSMRWADGALEFVLPSAFVDTARLPLVLDPLVGTTTVLGGANDDLVPEVAYDASTDTYLVVWQRDLSLTNQDLRAQRLNGAGAVVGGTLVIESSTTSASRPRVANVNLRNAFVVAWNQGGDVQARGVAAATGTTTAILAVAATTDTETQVDIAGDANDAIDDDALCVWANTTTGDIELRQVTYTAGGALALTGLQGSLANPLFSSYSNPCISQNGGGAGTYLVCWESFGSLSSKTTVRGAVVNRNLTVVVPDFLVATHTFDARDPDCDGDGDAQQWVVAFEREEAAGGDTDVYSVPVHLDGTAVVLGLERSIDSGVGDNERDPAVCWLQDSCLVAWSDEFTTSDYDTYVASISPLRCSSCEGDFALDTATAVTASFPAMAWRYTTTGADNNDAMIVWQAFDIAGSTGDVATRRWSAADGFTRTIQNACNNGGILAAKCPRAGNIDFRFELRGANPNGTAMLVLSPARIDLACGPCTLVPDPWLGFVAGFTGTNAAGDGSWPLALPSGAGGVELYAQWIATGTACFTGFDLSTAATVRLP